MPSGLRGYNVFLDGVKINNDPIPNGGTIPLAGLSQATDYSSRITVTAIDKAGNESEPVTLADLGTTATTTVPSPDDPLPADITAAIDALVASKLKPNTKTDGALVGIVTPNGSYYKAYGGDRTSGQTLTLAHRTRYGSISKMYCNTLVLAQIDAGHISFDDTLDQFVSGVANGDKITIRHLLMMQSGIKDYLGEDAAVQQSYFLNPTSTFDPMPYIRSYEPMYEPGESSSYSNSNTILLGKILEWCDAEYGSGRGIRQIILEDACATLGLDETEWPTGNYLSPPYMRGWTPNLALPQIQALLGPLAFLAGLFGYPTAAELEWTAVSTTWAGAAGSLGGTIYDLVKFGEHLRDGTLLSPEMKRRQEEEFVTYVTYDPKGPWEGPGWMGFGLNTILFGYWQGWIGNLGGYISVLFYNKRDGSIIALSLNNFTAESVDLFYRIAYLLKPEDSVLSPWILRPRGKIGSTSKVGKPGVYVYHEPGDEDGNTEVPLKVPFYI
ncbi:minor tail protein [Mycobacterium phage TelAviv]|nr:minor tail protein [Mycobacterium phage Blessica]QPO16544.1 minor tail protein [Mycobacterium phage TelAviv]WUT94706.1 minor tail protein [Mycobacterium phage Suarez]